MKIMKIAMVCILCTTITFDLDKFYLECAANRD